jgi:hypothetical protein
MFVKSITNGWVVRTAMAAMLALACSPLGSLLGGGGGGTVANLWPDVPQYPGSGKIDAELPLAARLLVEGLERGVAAEAEADGGEFAGVDFIVYETSDSPDQVGGFYTYDRMAAQGWTAMVEEQQTGCSDAAPGDEVMGTFCIFGQRSGDEVAALIIMAIPDEESGKTRIYYARLEGTRGGE